MSHPDEALTAEHAKAIIVAAFPEFRGMDVVLLNEGYDFQMFEVEARWLFRFPKRKESVAKLNREHQLLPGLGKSVPLPIPSYELFGKSNEHRGWPFAGYKRLPGIPGDQSKAVDPSLVARQIGPFLDALHAYPTNRARAAGIVEKHDLVAHWRDRAFEGLRKIVGLDEDLRGVRDYLENDDPVPFGGTPTLVHNDLWAEHILISPESGGVIGVIDWGDVVIGDPAVDFAGLYTWFGKRWVENALAYYSRSLGTEGMLRARFLATCLVVHTIALGQELHYTHWVRSGRTALRLILAR